MTVKLLLYYVVGSFLLTLVVGLALVYEDVDHRYFRPWKHGAAKGYNFSRNGWGWWAMGACLPFVNLVTVYLILRKK